MNITLPPTDPVVKGFQALVKSDLDPTMWDIVYHANQELYVFTQKETGRVVADSMKAWKEMLKQEVSDA